MAVNFRPVIFIFIVVVVIAFIEGNEVCSREDSNCFAFSIR